MKDCLSINYDKDLLSYRKMVGTRSTYYFTINFLRAVVEVEDKFTASEAINKYKIGTSGNVKRIREALENKEIIDTLFGKPLILAPLFEPLASKNLFYNT